MTTRGPAIRLHGYWRSSTTWRTRIALNLKGLAYETAPVNLAAGEHKEAAYLALNPAGTVPALEWDGRIYTQSVAILELLEERVPTPSLWPTDAEERATARELAFAIATETHAPNNMRALNWLQTNLGADDEHVRAWVGAVIHATFGPLETRLSQRSFTGLPFGAPTAFEIMLVPQIYNARRYQADVTRYPTLVAIDAACAQIEAFRRAIPANQPDAVG